MADRVGSLIYAVEPDSQAYKTMRDYKARFPGDASRADVAKLLELGLAGHVECAEKAAGGLRPGWTVVPSTRNRTVLRELVVDIARQPQDEVVLAANVPQPEKRVLRPVQWRVESATVPRHVLVIDDAWVSGGHAQSIAAALKAAGASQVSVFTVARVLAPKWSPTEPFLKAHAEDLRFDLNRCPWTGGECPTRRSTGPA